MINPKNLKKSILDYAIRGELSAKFRRENADNTTAFDEIAAYNAKITQIKGQRETLLLQIEKQHKSEKNAHRKARLKTLSGSLKNKIKTYRTITPLNQNAEFTPPFEIPNSWAWVKLGDLGEIITGSTPSTTKQEYYGNDYPFYKPSDLDNGYLIDKAESMVSNLGYQISRKLPKKSILVTCIGATIGKTAIINKEGICNQQINAIMPLKVFSAEYIYYFCISDYFQKEIIKNASATTLPILNKNRFENLQIPLPPLAEQQFIAGQLEQALTACEQYESTVNALLNLEDGLFNKISKSVLDYAIHGELSAQYRRENAPAVIASRDLSRRGNLLTTQNTPNDYNNKEIATPTALARNDGNYFSGSLKTDTVILSEAKNLKMDNTNLSGSLNDENHHPNCHCETCQKANRGNLPTTENQANDYNDKEIATTATQSRNDGVLTAFDEIAAYNAKITQIKGQRETLLLQIEKQLKAEKGTKRKKDTVIASEQSERGNLLTMENAPNLHSDKGIATTATQSRNDGFPAREVFSGSTKTPEQRTEQLKRISGSLKNKIKTYRTITPLNQNPEFTPPFDIPKEWAWVKLGEIATINGGYAFKSTNYTTNGVRVIRISDFNENGFIDTNIVRLPYLPEYEPFILGEKNILLCMTGGTVGKSFFVKKLEEKMIVNQRVATIKVRNALPEYVNYNVIAPIIQKIIQESKNSTNDNISMETINCFPIPLPPLAEQQFIAGQLEKLLDLCKKLKTKP